MAFIKTNLNPLNKKAADSHIRAIAAACNITWDEAFKDLAEEAFKQKDDLFSTNVVSKVLENKGFTAGKVSVPKGSKRPTVESFTEQNKDKVCVMKISGYWVACAYGNYVDIDDCGSCSLYKFWYKTL